MSEKMEMRDPGEESAAEGEPAGAAGAVRKDESRLGAASAERDSRWPSLRYVDWKDTYGTLHMWTQIVGKIRLALSPMVNHWWQVTLYVTPRGLTTSSIPYGMETFEILFDFIDHNLTVHTSDGATRAMGLYPRSVAEFYRELMSLLSSLGIQVKINTTPQEVLDPIPFEADDVHASYDAEYANRFWRILVQSDNIFKEFRGRFMGKCSPVHFFWGSFDLAVTRFSGRRAPVRPELDFINREAYSHECISVGWWPGSGNLLEPAFYSYASPEPSGYSQASVLPAGAYYDQELKIFILKNDDVRRAPDPRAALLEFLQTTYDVGADLAGWDRSSLERS